MNRWLLTALVTGLVWGGYRGYALAIRPLTEPPAAPPVLEVAAAPLPQRPEEFVEAERFLQDAKWTRQAKYKIKHGDNGYFFFDSYTTDGPKVELKPFAMLVRPSSQERGPPYLVHCTSARLTFQRDFQIGGESPGRLIGAVLEGEFQISGPNALLIKGRDARFDEAAHQLYSDHPIEFVYAPEEGRIRVVRGNADRLQINFVPSTTSPHGRDMPRIAEIESITLRRDVRVSFRHLQGTEQITSQISSAGPFVFKVPERVATFQEQVNVLHPRGQAGGAAAFDTLKADWLALQFEPKPPEIPPGAIGGRAAALAAEDDSPLANLRLRSVRALSRNASAPVQVRSAAANFTGVMRDLLYDAVERMVTMQAPEPGVQFDNGEARLWAPAVRVQHDAAGNLTYVEALQKGRLDVDRPAPGGGAPQRLQALWSQRLTMQPDQPRDLMIVTLDGDARVILPDEVGILCDRLTLDVDAQSFQSQSGGGLLGDGAARTAPASARAPAAGELPLKHALAEGHVAMAGPTFEIETSRLDVTFRAGRLPKGATNTAAGTAWHSQVDPAHRVTVAVPSSGPSQAFASVPNPDPAGVAVGGLQPPPGSGGQLDAGRAWAQAPRMLQGDDKWDLTARTIQALVLQNPEGKEAELREVIGEGDVVVKQLPRAVPLGPAPSAPAEEPLTVTGDRLHLLNEGGLDQALHLRGAPAHLRQNGMHIEGNELFFDREANTAQVIGKGMLQAPVPEGMGGGPRDKPAQLDVHWLREMKFDGSTARFIEGVRTRLDDSVMRCDEMQVTLNRHVDFSSRQPDTAGLAIQSVLCLRGVEVEFYQWSTPQDLASRAVGKAAEFQLRYDTGDFEARGGGRLEVWQRKEESRVDVRPTGVVQANQPAVSELLPWQYTHVVFHDRIVGNMHRRNATLYDRVWVTHAPVERSTQVFTRDELSRDTESANHAVWMGCDELQISLHPWAGPAQTDRDQYVQVLGIGKLARVELEGRLFQANSDTLSYDESTKLFTLRGRGRNGVSLSRQEYPGGPYTDLNVQSVQFNPAQRSGSFQGATGAAGAP